MKTIRLIFFSLLVLGIQTAFAADDHSLLTGETMNYIGYGAIMVALIVLIIAMTTVLKAFKVVARLLMGPEGGVDTEAKKEELQAARKAARATGRETSRPRWRRRVARHGRGTSETAAPAW